MQFFKCLLLTAVLITALNTAGCKGENTPPNPIKFDKISERPITITQERQFSGFPLGLSLAQGETYIEDDIHPKGKFLIHFVDVENGTVKRTLELKAGDYQSPTEFFSPHQIQLIDDRYYILDQVDKIVVYDQQFRYLYSSMFYQSRYFLNLFKQGQEIHFVLAACEITENVVSRVKLYQLPAMKKPQEIKTISEKFKIKSIYSYIERGSKDYYCGYFWPSVKGFEKDQTIIYSIGDTKDIYVYSLGSGEQKKYSLSYLHAKKYTDKDAYILGHLGSEDGDEKYKRQTGGEMKYVAYPKDSFHLGIYDVGKGKIGVVGDFNIKKMTFRLDIIDTQKWQYLESIWFPAGYSFNYSIYAVNNGLVKTFIDVDKGIYIYCDIVGEDEEYVTKIVRFK